MKPDIEVLLIFRAKLEGCCCQGSPELEIKAYPAKSQQKPDYNEIAVKGMLSQFAKRNPVGLYKIISGLPYTKKNKDWNDKFVKAKVYYEQNK